MRIGRIAEEERHAHVTDSDKVMVRLGSGISIMLHPVTTVERMNRKDVQLCKALWELSEAGIESISDYYPRSDKTVVDLFSLDSEYAELRLPRWVPKWRADLLKTIVTTINDMLSVAWANGYIRGQSMLVRVMRDEVNVGEIMQADSAVGLMSNILPDPGEPHE